MNEQNTEEWKKVTSGREFSVSSFGRIRDDSTGEIRKAPAINSVGYQYVGGHISGTGNSCGLHRVVATLFVPNPEGKPDINHKNGVKHDNRADNLEWVTHRENIQMASKQPNWRRGVKAKITGADATEARRLWATGNFTMTALGLKYGLTPTSIYNIINRFTWKHAA